MNRALATGTLNLEPGVRWYVVANRAGAVFYGEGLGRKFHFVERISDAAQNAEKPVHEVSNPGEGVNHSSRRVSHLEEVAGRFAKRIAGDLDEAYRQKRFRDLILVAEPHFLGLLRSRLGRSARRAVIHEIPREYAQGSDEELRFNIARALQAQES